MSWINGELNVEHVSINGIKALDDIGLHKLASHVLSSVTRLNDNHNGRSWIADIVFDAETTDQGSYSPLKRIPEGKVTGCETTANNGD